MRVALLGSPGVALPYRTVLDRRYTGTGALITGAAATYAAVVAGHHLDIQLTGGPLIVITFAGTENTQALFIAAINAQGQGMIIARNNGGQIQLETIWKGSLAVASVAATSSADVQASTGLAAGAFVAPVTLLTDYGLFMRKYGGGAAFQKFLMLNVGGRSVLFLLDRAAGAATFSDNVRFAPTPV